MIKVTRTELRKNLFALLERAAGGETIVVTHRRRSVQIVPAPAPTRMSRLIKRDTIVGGLESLEQAQQELSRELDQAWEDSQFFQSERI